MTNESFDFEACLRQVRDGDQGAASALVENLYPFVARIIRARLPRRVQEEDLAQEIFIKMFRRLDQYEGRMPFPNWVSRIAVTTCIDHLRAQKRRPEYRWADLSEGEADFVQAITRDESSENPADSTAARELLEKLLETLGAKDRTIITMLDLEQRSLAEIAAMTGWTETMIKVRAFRARKKLKQAFERLIEDEQNG